MRRLERLRTLSRLPEHLLEWALAVRFNGSTEKATQEIVKILNMATFEVEIVAGVLRELFVKEDIRAGFKDAIERGVTIRMICAPNPKAESKALFELAEGSKGKFEIRKARDYPATHYFVVDKRHLLIEERHAPNAPVEEHRGITLRDRPEPAARQSVRFKRLWHSLPPLVRG